MGITTQSILQALQDMDDGPLECVAVTARIMELRGNAADKQPLTPEILLEMGPQVESALRQANQVSSAGRRILTQVLALPPAAHPRVPLGF